MKFQSALLRKNHCKLPINFWSSWVSRTILLKMSRALYNKPFAVVMTTCATSHPDPPHDIAQLIFPLPSKEIEPLQFQTMGLTYTYFRLHYFSVWQGWSWQRLCLNSFKSSFSVQNSIKVQKKSLKFLRGRESKKQKEEKNWVPSWSAEHWLYRKGLKGDNLNGLLLINITVY